MASQIQFDSLSQYAIKIDMQHAHQFIHSFSRRFSQLILSEGPWKSHFPAATINIEEEKDQLVLRLRFAVKVV